MLNAFTTLPIVNADCVSSPCARFKQTVDIMAGAPRRLRRSPEPVSLRRSMRRSNNKASEEDDSVPAVFQEMLREEQASMVVTADSDEHPLKKRKIAQLSRTTSAAAPSLTPTQSQGPLHDRRQPLGDNTPISQHVAPASWHNLQTVVDSDESESSDGEWEDALAERDGVDDNDEDVQGPPPQVADISITIGSKKQEELETRKIRKRAITSVDKRKRLDIHKMHVLCLLNHVHRRNAWCNDLRAQTALRKLVPPKILLNLVPNPSLTQYSASKRFVEAMNELKVFWAKRFRLTAHGMYKPKWAEPDAGAQPSSDFDELDDPMDKDDFREAARTLQGSQDVGAQLFCALLRGIGIESRLVCSLQPLPFASLAQPSTPQKSGTHKATVVVDPYNKHDSPAPSKPQATTVARPKKLSRMERVMGERHIILNNAGAALQRRKVYQTPYPVYWVEVFNPAHQKWVPIDTHSTFTVNSPEKLEPPLSFVQNSLTYAIAYEEDYTAKDVTRRYAKAYNAKTRKFRVESTPHGAEWWRRTAQFIKRRKILDRDHIEDMALARKEASEGVPKNVQDFKDHPVYVLERHLKHNEVIHPLNPIGKVNVGTAMNTKMVPIYRRKDVHSVRTADKWYRMGQDIKDGEQPLKHAKPKRNRRPSIGPSAVIDEQEDIGAGLYAEFQTQLYVPPPVVRGRVPRNAYGNLDLYVPSMCPSGGTHVRHKLASKAAHIIGVDYANAVTGFSFKGRHGTAIVQGVVVSSDYAEAVEEVIAGMMYEQEEAANAARTRESLRLWRRFFLGLRIAQRVNAMDIDGEKGPAMKVQDQIDKDDRELAKKAMAGGFFPNGADFAESTLRTRERPPQDYGADTLSDDENGDRSGASNADHGSSISKQSLVLNREHSFESSILDSQQFRLRGRSKLTDDFLIEKDAENDLVRSYLSDDLPEAGSSTRQEQLRRDYAQDDSAADSPQHSAEDEDEDINIAIAASIQQAIKSSGSSPPPLPPPPPPPPVDPASWEPKGIDTANATDKDHMHNSSPSDADSLPLEDPEDEDADPDWLVDAT